jgi:diaminopimelate epimerase
MAGGEFCGNASRAAAILCAKLANNGNVAFTVSGFDGIVSANVKQVSETVFDVRCEFPSMPVRMQRHALGDGQLVTVVDLGGIVHVVVEGVFPSDPVEYTALHRRFMQDLGLGAREAVGVIWYERHNDQVLIHPVVWVNAVNTFFYETSCGSGTIAVGKVTGDSVIVQPTGKPIMVEFAQDAVALQSEMEIISPQS